MAVVVARIGKAASSEYPRCKEEAETPEHIMFRCKEIIRIEDPRSR